MMPFDRGPVNGETIDGVSPHVRNVQDTAPREGDTGPMDLTLARAFMATHARILDRRRFLRLLQEGQPSDVLAAVDAYRNDDGGYGWGLEADLRSPESQTGGALHAFEAFADMAPVTTRRAVELCDWLNTVSLDDGGLPFAFPESGCLPVPGGREDELMRPLDFAPRPDGPVRTLFSPDVIAAELDRLESLQQADGGWPEEWGAFSPAAALEWRGWLTVRAVSILQANGRAGR